MVREDGKRRWWKRKSVWAWVGLALLPVLLVAAWVSVRRVRAEAHLEQIIADIRARGEPVEWSEFAPPPIAPEDNAATYYREAVQLMEAAEAEDAVAADGTDANAPPADMTDLALAENADLRRKRRGAVARRLARREEVFDLCRKARACERAVWDVDYSAPAVSVVLPNLQHLRTLAQALHLKAVAAADGGKETEALDAVRDLLALSRHESELPSVIAYLSGTNASLKACDALEQILPALRGSAELRGPAREIIDDVLADDGFHQAMMDERAMVYDTLHRVRSGEFSMDQLVGVGGAGGPSLLGLLGAGVGAGEMAAGLEVMNAYVRAAAAETAPAALRRMPDTSAEAMRARGTAVAMLVPALGMAHTLHFQHMASRRLAAAAAAIRLYQFDHDGKRPERLEQLVPDYLRAVPMDPFTEPAESIRYLPHADPPVLYSVSKNGIDDGGKTREGQDADLVFHLNGPPPQDDGSPGPGGVSAR